MPPSAARSPSPFGGAASDIEFALALEDAAGADCIGALACGRRSSFSYRRLPEPRLRLTVRKLDASCFDVQTARSAAVWELKAAIEDLFADLYDDADRTITWQSVWSHFCLCFKDVKLTDDRATLRAFGIRDGDELHFVQHLSVDYRPRKSLSKNHKAASHRRSVTSLEEESWRPSTLLDALDENEVEKFTDPRHSTSVLEDDFCVYQYEQLMEEGYKKGGFFRGWFSYSRLRGNRRTHAEDVVPSSCEQKKNTRAKLGSWFSSKRSKTRCN